MSDVLIRDVPEDVLATLDQLAARLGLSRTEYIRRRLTQDARAARVTVASSDWQHFADTYRDLGDAAVIDQAWR